MGRAVILLQARLGSRRLPGKVLAEIDGRTILAHCVERLARERLAPVVVATTTEPEDVAIVDEAHRLGALVLCGDRDDVLARFTWAARELGADIVVRATGDNPAVDMSAAARCLRVLHATGADYVVERGLPYGGAVEAVRAAALERAFEEATDPADREHVTRFVRRQPTRFHVVEPRAPVAVTRPDLRFTVDTMEDLVYMRDVMTAAGPADRPAPLVALVAAADRLAARVREGAA